MQNRAKVITLFILVLAGFTGILFTIFAVVQQSYRQNANDPQVQVTEDVAYVLEQGRKPEEIIPPQSKLDISRGLSVFVIIYGEDGKPLASSGELDKSTPQIAKSALLASKSKADHRITWEPKKGLRVAAVIKHIGGKGSGYVLAGRNLREVESREKNLLTTVAIGEIGLVILWLIGLFVFLRTKSESTPETLIEEVVVTEVVVSDDISDEKKE